jgi:ligand-binding sensor domain-containing protein
MKRAFLLLMITFVYLGVSYSQGTWTVYNTSNSEIPSNDIVSFAMPDPGHIYIGTPGGLVTPGKVFDYDGNSWSEIEWISGFNEIVRNSDDDLVIANQGGVYHFDGDQYILFNEDNSGLTANYIQDVDADEEGNEYAAMTASGLIFVGGVAIFNGADWNSFNSGNSPMPVNNVLCVLKSDDGPLWIGTQNGGLVKKINDDWELFDTENSSIPGNTPICMAETSDGTLWSGFDNRSIATYDGNDWEIIKEPSSREFPNADIIEIFIDASDNVWVSFANNGFGRFDGFEWAFYTSQTSGLPHNRVTGFGESGQGEIWIGTDGGGLAVFEPDYASVTDFPEDTPDINIYPNPADNWVTFELTGPGMKFPEIYICNYLGQEIWHDKTSSGIISFDCSEMNPGVYHVTFSQPGSGNRISKSFIIK